MFTMLNVYSISFPIFSVLGAKDPKRNAQGRRRKSYGLSCPNVFNTREKP